MAVLPDQHISPAYLRPSLTTYLVTISSASSPITYVLPTLHPLVLLTPLLICYFPHHNSHNSTLHHLITLLARVSTRPSLSFLNPTSCKPKPAFFSTWLTCINDKMWVEPVLIIFSFLNFQPSTQVNIHTLYSFWHLYFNLKFISLCSCLVFWPFSFLLLRWPLPGNPSSFHQKISLSIFLPDDIKYSPT